MRRTSEEIVKEFEEHQPMKWNKDIFVQLKYEYDLVKQLEEKEIERFHQANSYMEATCNNEDGKLHVQFHYEGFGNNMNINIFVHNETLPIQTPFPIIAGDKECVLNSPGKDGYYDVKLMNDKEVIIEKDNLVIGKVFDKDEIEIDKTTNDRKGVYINWKNRSGVNDVICIYQNDDNINEHFISKINVMNGVKRMFIEITENGNYVLKYFVSENNISSTSPYVFIKKFSL